MAIQHRVKILMVVGLFVALLAPLSPAVLASPRVAYAAPTGCNVTGEAYGSQTTGNALVASNKTVDVILPPGGTASAGTTSSPFVSTGPVTDTSLDVSLPTQATAATTSTVSGAKVLGGVITGDFQSVATSTSDGATAVSASGGSRQTYSINGGAPQSNPGPNTRVTAARRSRIRAPIRGSMCRASATLSSTSRLRRATGRLARA